MFKHTFTPEHTMALTTFQEGLEDANRRRFIPRM